MGCRLVALILFAALSAVAALAQTGPADLILHSGKIVTVDPSFSIAEAIAVRGDRILGVGTTAEMRKLVRRGHPNDRSEGKDGASWLDRLSHAPACCLDV